LQAAQPDRERVATQLREAADAMAEVRSGLGDTASAGSAAAGSGAQVAVQQQAPQVTVQQPQPQVTVQQPAPQVTVQQPAPQVTVQQPQPQVTVRQPEPQVTVQQAEPQVRVQRQGEPQVTVQREGQPQVTVQREGQAQTDMQRQGTQTGQRTGAEQRTGASATPAPAQSGASRPAPAAATQATGMDLQSVQSLIGTNVYGANGREAGEVENLLIDSAGRVRAAVVEWGGFLGIGERQAMVPIERIQLGGQNGRATLDMTREELEALPRYDRNSVAGYASERGWGDGARLYR
jgi:sporulation protein YlmC with PRC-barrel domain